MTIYGHWVDGRADFDGGRSDYPPMADQYGNGCGHNFAVWEPAGGRPPGSLPLVMVLHGGGQNLISPRQGAFLAHTQINDGLVATLDDGLGFPDSSSGVAYTNSFWVGYWNGLNRFAPTNPPETAVVVDYTVRRLRWELGYLRNRLPIDSSRVSIMGASMGGMGTLFYTQVFSPLFSAGIAFVPPLAGPVRDETAPLIGTRNQNLKTTLPGSPGIWDVLIQAWRDTQPHVDWPPTNIVCGKHDTIVGWIDKPGACRQLDSTRKGCMFYWDQREHIVWAVSHFASSGRSHASSLTPFRTNRSFPAFSATDLDTTAPGRQPDPGNGNPLSGDTWGTWGGYLDWDKERLVDTTGLWEVRTWVVTNSPIQCDNCPSPWLVAAVTPRRLQGFHPLPNQLYHWELADTIGNLLCEGVVAADSSGAVTTPVLSFGPFPQIVRIGDPGPGMKPGSGQRPNAAVGLRILPNPFATFATVPGSERRRLDVYDASGRRVGVYYGTKLGDALEPGVYFVRPADQEVSLLRVVKIR